MSILLKRSILQVSVIMFAALVAYIPAMRAGFVWDDDRFLTENPLIKADDGLYRFWFTTEPPDYFPLVSTSLWLEWRLWGMNAKGYHVVNVVLHAVSSVLIWLVLKRLKIPGAWLAGLIFAVHPVNVESVAWITERKNTQPMVFYLLTILFYLRFESHRGRRWYVFALCSFLLALLSKTSVVMLPFVLLGCAWWQRGSILSKDLMRAVPFLAMSGVLGLVSVWFQYNVNIAGSVVRADSFLSRLAGAGWAVWFYLYKAIIPYKLSFVYPRWTIDASSIVSYLPLIVLLGCFGVFWKYRRSWGKPFLFGLAYYVVTLFPVLGFFDIYFMKYSLVADHWQYVSLVGIIALLAGGGVWIWHGWRRQLSQLGTIAAIALVGLLGVLTWNQCHIYTDVEKLWHDTISKNPDGWLAHNNLGNALAKKGRLKEAISHYSEALRIDPDSAKTHNNLASALFKQGDLNQAVSHYSEALRIDPDYAKAHINLAKVLAKQGGSEEAVSHYSEALRIAPNFVESHNSLGLALVRQGNLEKAITHFRDAVRIKPDCAEAHNNWGGALYRLGNLEEAISHFGEAVRINPNYAEAHNNWAAALHRLGKLQDAIAHYSEALRIKPDYISARRNLNLALRQAGKHNEESNTFTGP